jgi:hypothetical protein
MRIEIRGESGRTDAKLAARAKRRLAFVLSRFGRSVERVFVSFWGPHAEAGRSELRCRVTTRLRGGCSIVVELFDDDPGMAVDRAVDRAGRAVARQIMRSRGAMAESPAVLS